jgi:hypothetical protein
MSATGREPGQSSFCYILHLLYTHSHRRVSRVAIGTYQRHSVTTVCTFPRPSVCPTRWPRPPPAPFVRYLAPPCGSASFILSFLFLHIVVEPPLLASFCFVSSLVPALNSLHEIRVIHTCDWPGNLVRSCTYVRDIAPGCNPPKKPRKEY